MTMGFVGRNTVVSFVMIAALLQSANGATLTVGGNTGWTVGRSSTFYDDWAKSQTFSVGDILDFVYPSDFHNVFEVTAADLASCNLNSPLKTYETSGGVSVPISTAGDHYYICGVPGHCLANMQMSIVVSAVAAAATAPTPTAPSFVVTGRDPSEAAPKFPRVTAPGTSNGHQSAAPAPGTSKGHQSAAPAMIVGVLLFVVASLLFQ